MQRHRAMVLFPWAFSSLTIVMMVVSASTSCGIDAVAVDGCRTLEDARCEQATVCPQLKVSDVKACQRFYRDQCLHGMAVATDPGTRVINACRDAIVGAGTCAQQGITDDSCSGYQAVAGALSPCDALAQPERMTACQFLIPPASGGNGEANSSGGGGGAAGNSGAGGETAGKGGNAQ